MESKQSFKSRSFCINTTQAEALADDDKFKDILKLSEDLKNKLETNVLLGDKNVNDIIDWF